MRIYIVLFLVLIQYWCVAQSSNRISLERQTDLPDPTGQTEMVLGVQPSGLGWIENLNGEFSANNDGETVQIGSKVLGQDFSLLTNGNEWELLYDDGAKQRRIFIEEFLMGFDLTDGSDFARLRATNVLGTYGINFDLRQGTNESNLRLSSDVATLVGESASGRAEISVRGGTTGNIQFRTNFANNNDVTGMLPIAQSTFGTMEWVTPISAFGSMQVTAPSTDTRQITLTDALGNPLLSNSFSVTGTAGTGADNWGSQVVVSDNTISGDGAGTALSIAGTNISVLNNDANYLTAAMDQYVNSNTIIATGGQGQFRLLDQSSGILSDLNFISSDIDFSNNTNRLELTIDDASLTPNWTNVQNRPTINVTGNNISGTIDLANNTSTINFTGTAGGNDGVVTSISGSGNNRTVLRSNGLPNLSFSVADGDALPNNELQTVSRSGNTITLSQGGGSFTDNDTYLNTELLFDEANGATFQLFRGGINELELEFVEGNDISIDNDGNGRMRIAYTGTNTGQTNTFLDDSEWGFLFDEAFLRLIDNNGDLMTQGIFVAGNGISFADDGTGALEISASGASDGVVTGFSGTGNTRTVARSNGLASLSLNVADSDASASNELQTLSKSGGTVTLSNGGGSFTDETESYWVQDGNNHISYNQEVSIGGVNSNAAQLELLGGFSDAIYAQMEFANFVLGNDETSSGVVLNAWGTNNAQKSSIIMSTDRIAFADDSDIQYFIVTPDYITSPITPIESSQNAARLNTAIPVGAFYRLSGTGDQLYQKSIQL